MTRAQGLLLADEDIRLRECAQEPIHVPGAIQPHGALLTVDPDSLEILQAGDNCADVLGVAASTVLGTDLSALIGAEAAAFLRSGVSDGTSSPLNALAVHLNGRAFDMVVHHVDDVGVVEFEPAVARSYGGDYLPALHAAIARLSKADDVAEVRRIAAREVRELTGFDQVMVYHFHPDGHGEVMADDHSAGMTPYLGLHFPASDIPAQARRLYQLKGSGLIASSDYQPVALHPVNNPRTNAPLDLSRAELRSVSPHHLQFMRNMGQGASLTLSLAHDGRLLGLITCAHRRPRRIPVLLRRTCEVLAQHVVLQLDAMTRTQGFARRLQARDVRDTLVEQMKASLDVTAGLTAQAVTLVDLIAADGATVCLQNRLMSVGATPSHTQTQALLAALTAGQTTVSPLLTDALAIDRPDLAALVPSVAGVFVMAFGSPGDCLVWFRREIAQAVDWLGAQSPDNRTTPLSPRTSFDLWRQTVTDRSAMWDEVEIAEAAELGRDIDQVLLRHAEAQLAHMARHDALTGLPNRRLLVERITSAVARAERHGAEVAILFCDLDDFKHVNDTAGHAAGDAVLVEAARRLRSALRTGDSVARVGGDEFVLVLEPAPERDPTSGPSARASVDPPGNGTGPPAAPADPRQAATRVAERIKTELCRPINYQGQDHVISVSIGITFATSGSRAEDLLSNADAAMYRAKQTGKNCVAAFDDALRTSIRDRAAAELALRDALAAGGPDRPHLSLHPRLSVVYQPAIDIDTGRLVSFEATPRLTDAAGRPVPPELLMAVARHDDTSHALAETVLDTALAALVTWRSGHPADPRPRMAVNLRAGQAQPADLRAAVRAVLDRHGLRPLDLTLELAESLLVAAEPTVLDQIAELRESGVAITVSEFGNGYASLRHLATLPVDAIRMDAAFATGGRDDAAGAAVVRAVAGLAADLGVACVFTGVDTEPQLAALPAGVIVQGASVGDPATVPEWVQPRAGRFRSVEPSATAPGDGGG